MKKKLFVLILALVVAFLFAIPVSAETQNGWVEEYGSWYYYEDGEKITNCLKEIDGDYYAFSSSGSKFEEEGLYNFHMQIGEDTYGNVVFYVTADNGKLLTNTWKETKFMFEEEGAELNFFYLGADGAAYRDGVYQVGDAKYIFDGDGRRDTGFVHYWGDEEEEKLYFADEDGKLFESEWFYKSRYEDEEPEWFYATADGTLLRNGIHQVNDYYYFFGYYGTLETGFVYDNDNNLYYADPDNDSRVKTNTWFQAKIYEGWEELDWFYATADGSLYHNTVENISGTLYAFYNSGEMLDDASMELGYWDEELQEYIITGYYRAKEGGALYTNEWYDERYGSKYYYTADGKAALGLVNIDGVNYFFDEYNYGAMLEDSYTYYYDGETERFFVADENGALTEVYNNTWAKIGKYWYYVKDGEFCAYGIYDIDGVKYGFNHHGQMYESCPFGIAVYDEDTGEYLYEDYYFAKGGGSVAENEWCLYENEYGSSWWYYAGNNGVLLTQGLYEVDGKTYWFGMDGSLIDNTIYYDGEEQLYICKINEDGSGGYLVTAEGWYTCEGHWIYVNSEGKVHEGWLNDQYYLNPEMYFGSYILMPEYVSEEEFYVELYLFNKNGTAEKITADGFYSAKTPFSYATYTVYLRDGKAVINDWVFENGNWYYFDDECRMIADESYTVKDVPYFFDQNGVMADDGWIRDTNGTWYYAYSSGALFTGIDASNYLFDESGALIVNSFYTAEDGKTYYADGNGIIIHTLMEGWNEIKGYRYYVQDGEMLSDCTSLIGDVRYAFDYQGKMISNDTYNGYLFGADGKQVINAWLQIDGKWYYSDEYGVYYSGIHVIDDKEYYFENQVLQQNATFFSRGEEAIITTDSEGIVVSIAPADGWVYYVDEYDYARGSVYYYRNGSPVTDWLGSYYVEDGYMVTDSVIEWKDAYYYLNTKGVYISGGWYERSEDYWMYARNDGSLYYDEWLFYNGAWYYFDSARMYSDGVIYIDGVLHSFDENGVWLGEAQQDYNNLPDGWFYYQNNWYYINATIPVRECELYIDGAWYAFNYDGTMAENRLFGNYYYLDGGKRAEYTGWVMLKTGWAYFNQDHSVAYGWIKDGNQYYFLDYDYEYDETTDKYYMAFAAIENDYRAIDGKLYYFNASCALQYEATADGWYQADGEWYCIQNGEACYSGIYKIGNVYYAFDSDGRMLHNETYDGKFFDESGAMVTESGWYYIEDEYAEGWIYILKDGRIASDGIFLIDGKEYAFNNYLWIG